MDSEITGLLCVSRLALRKLKDDVYLYDQPKNIKCAPKIKILGWHLNECLNYDSTINQQVSLVEKTIISLQPISRLLSEKQKMIIANAHLLQTKCMAVH